MYQISSKDLMFPDFILLFFKQKFSIWRRWEEVVFRSVKLSLDFGGKSHMGTLSCLHAGHCTFPFRFRWMMVSNFDIVPEHSEHSMCPYSSAIGVFSSILSKQTMHPQVFCGAVWVSVVFIRTPLSSILSKMRVST